MNPNFDRKYAFRPSSPERMEHNDIKMRRRDLLRGANLQDPFDMYRTEEPLMPLQKANGNIQASMNPRHARRLFANGHAGTNSQTHRVSSGHLLPGYPEAELSGSIYNDSPSQRGYANSQYKGNEQPFHPEELSQYGYDPVDGTVYNSEFQYNRSENNTKGWDVFAMTPPVDEDETLDSRWYKLSIKVLKLCAYIITFVVVLGSAFMSKTLMLFMTSLIKPNRTGIAICNQGIAGLDRDKRYEAIFHLNDPERVAWIWCLLFALLVPELMTLFRSVRICTFKSFSKPSIGVFLTVFTFETLHTLGVILLVFVVLPSLDVLSGAMLTNCLCVIPGILALLSRHVEEQWRLAKMLLDLIALFGQFTGLIRFGISSPVGWQVPVCALLISFGWWENYADQRSSIDWVSALGRMKQPLHRARYFTYAIVSSWKLALYTGGMFATRYWLDGSCWYLLSQFRSAFGQHKLLIARSVIEGTGHSLDGVEHEWLELDVFGTTPLWFLFAQLTSSWLCYVFGKFACKICMQRFSFALPLLLTVPLCMLALASGCELHTTDSCSLIQFLPRYLFWSCSGWRVTLGSPESWIWLLCMLSQVWICVHICRPKCERLATTEKLFVTPMYSAAFVDQSMMMNRRRDDRLLLKTGKLLRERDTEGRRDVDTTAHYETISEAPEAASSAGGPISSKSVRANVVQKEDYTTRILVCATMWHETKEEMIQMLKSVFRMDEDQCAKKNAKQYFNEKMQDYYEFDVHIFFDDAFEYAENCDEMVVNTFVRQFFTVLDEAATNVHQTEIHIKPPKKYPTPYGGRLEWVLPGKNRLIAHLKDKTKIRHRKRWSQVMYMYYLLGHCLMEQPIEVARKAVRAENTYILALDGDINFRPSAVQLLVDLMKKNRRLGAACGRIHPVGSGPMVWYQKFEYAIGHWLQKATEHMIGCVLCSPGCFSLFRAKALMDDNVMRKYTRKSEEALHYVQYDQGEDRWLCTLLLQRGYRVEYSAASDAYTHCPDTFAEFYTQRRRWAPSTMANIMDLLGDYKRTVAINDNISLPYIIYQGMLMVGTILGPGTIFLMLVGALVAVFRISNWYSFQLNLVPILVFMLICFTMKNDYQILTAQFMSACYALLMMAVFVGTSIQMTEDGVSSPSAMFFIALTGTFFVAAFLHPQEFGCVVPIILYFLSIPCMYLLLIIYSLINLNVVTWGTRETAPRERPSAKNRKPTVAPIKEQSKQGKQLMDYFQRDQQRNESDNADEEEGGIVISLANLFKCMFFTYPKPNATSQHFEQIKDTLNDMKLQVSSLERTVATQRRRAPSSMIGRRPLDTVSEHGENEDELSLDSMRIREEDDFTDVEDDESVHDTKPQRNELVNPYWIEDKNLQDGPVCFLPPEEIQFFRDLIDKYLFPLIENKQEQQKIKTDLVSLRNQVVFAFMMVNALFILVVFLLQLNKDILHVEWPFGFRENITFIPETNEIRVEKHYLQMEPIGLVFVLFFGLILIIQFVGMMFHRFATLSHILASVELFESKKQLSIEDELSGNAAALAKHFQKLKGINDDDRDSLQRDLGGRNIVERLEERKHASSMKISTLDVAFKKRFEQFAKATAANRANQPPTPVLGHINRETLSALKRKGNNLLGEVEAFSRNNRNRATLDKLTPRRPFSSSNTNNKAGETNEGFEPEQLQAPPRHRQRRATSPQESLAMSALKPSNGSMVSLDNVDIKPNQQDNL